LAFQISPPNQPVGAGRFFEWFLVSTFLFSVTLGGQPFGFRRPYFLFNLPILVYICKAGDCSASLHVIA